MRAGPLEPGTYRVRDLLGKAKGAALTAGDRGAFDGYLPFPSLEPNQSAVLLLD